MKTICARATIMVGMGPAIGIGIVMGIYAFVALFDDRFIDVGVSLVIFATLIFLGVWFICKISMRDYWIKYGDGRIIIHRYSKILNARGSKMERRENEFLLEEIELYGASAIILGKNVELSGSQGGALSWSYEYFFQLKDGKRIGFDATIFGRFQLAELSRYIYGETGIEKTMHKLDSK